MINTEILAHFITGYEQIDHRYVAKVFDKLIELPPEFVLVNAVCHCCSENDFSKMIAFSVPLPLHDIDTVYAIIFAILD